MWARRQTHFPTCPTYTPKTAAVEMEPSRLMMLMGTKNTQKSAQNSVARIRHRPSADIDTIIKIMALCS